jgi:hypothetical protein
LEWFTGTPIQRENIKEWLLYAFFSCQPSEAGNQYDEELEKYLTTLEDLRHTKFQPGRNKKVSAMKPGFDALRMLHRPLAWYFVSAIYYIVIKTWYLMVRLSSL